MRLAYLVTKYPVLTETFVVDELTAVAEQGHEIQLFPLRRMHPQLRHPEPDTLRVRYTPLISWRFARAHLHYLLHSPRTYLGCLLTLLRANFGSRRYLLGALAYFPKGVYLARIFQAERIEHIHAHFASHPAAIAYLIAGLTGIPYSFTAHGSDLHRDQHMLREKVARARFVVTVSHYNREKILTHAPPAAADRIHVVRCGIDTQRVHQRLAATRSALFRLLCIGTLHEVKGQRVLLEACRQLIERGLPVACHLIGEGPDRAELAELVCGPVEFHGACTRSEVLDYLCHCDVLVAPSVPTADGRREGIPVALMEAMAVGVPVVASDLSGIPELVVHEHSGLLTPPGDAAELAITLDRLYHDPALRSRLVQNARETIERDFSLHGSARTLSRLFSEGVGP